MYVTNDHVDQVGSLDSIIATVRSGAGTHLLEEFGKAEVFNTLQNNPPGNIPTGPLASMCNAILFLQTEVENNRFKNEQILSLLKELATIVNDSHDEYMTKNELRNKIMTLNNRLLSTY